MSYLTRTQLIKNYPVPKSRPGLRKWIKQRGFPRPIYANANTPLWMPVEVEEWYANRPTNHHDAIVDRRGI
jgi:predicted DNA-binding transcriptional regulator AlpA